MAISPQKERKAEGMLTPEQVQQQAITLLKTEKEAWETATCFVTDRVAFNMRELIKVLRKNYWGIFDEPTDPNTGRKKIWVPLTESTVDATLKNIDLDTKDINFRAKNPKSIGLTSVVRNVVRSYLDGIGFGELLDEFERALCIDGTAVWKTYEDFTKDGKKRLKVRLVDLLNFYIDPNARSIEESAVIERALLTPEEVKSMKGWLNTDDVEGNFDVPRTGDRSVGTIKTGNKYVEVFERWGMVPKSFFTLDKDDEGELVEAQIVVSNLTKSAKVHLIKENKKGVKPYEEAWYSRVPGRWYGRGPAEKVMMLQIWLNTIVNIRINRSFVSQLGIFKIRQGSGITPQMISRLPANGAITVTDPKDIEQFVMQEASQASYTDENVIQGWAERTTSTFESVTGESMPSSTPATNAAIASRAGQTQFVFVKKGIGMFLQRWVKNQVLPTIAKHISRDEIIRITGDIEELREIDERIANHLLHGRLSEFTKKGKFFKPEDVEREKRRVIEKLGKMGANRYIKLLQDIDLTDYDVQVYVTNEEIDKAVLLQDLIQMLQTVSGIPNTGIDPVMIARQIFDVMGIDSASLKLKQQQPQMPPEVAQMMQQPQQTGSVSPQQITTKANTKPYAAP